MEMYNCTATANSYSLIIFLKFCRQANILPFPIYLGVSLLNKHILKAINRNAKKGVVLESILLTYDTLHNFF